MFSRKPVIIQLFAITALVSAASTDALADYADDAKKLLNRLNASAAPEIYVEVARELGQTIDALRQSDPTRAQIEAVAAVVDQMRARSFSLLKNVEGEAGESEAALERLYRSAQWDNLSFALAAFPYWRAWIDIAYADHVDAGEQLTVLSRAHRGFRTASMQLFRPGLIFGGWLGLGYVALARGEEAQATRIFENLQEALAAEEDHPIREAVELELRLLAVKRGQVKNTPIPKTIGEAEASILRAEAFALLKKQRNGQGGGVLAAERLNKLIKAGYLDQQLVDDMIYYRQEVASQDVGRYTDLAAAEYALEYDHYFTAIEKYSRFFRTPLPANVNFEWYRYRWALAAYKDGILGTAADILEKQRRLKDLDPDLQRSIAKLLYVVYAAREQKGGSSDNRRALRSAAQNFIQKSPNDPGADSARLMIAQTSNNVSAARKSLSQVRSKESLQGAFEATAFHIVAREFIEAINRPGLGNGYNLAKQGLKTWPKLAKKDRRNPQNLSIFVQMRSLVDKDPEAVLRSVDQIEQSGVKNLDVKRALYWSRLRLYERLGKAERVGEFIRAEANNRLTGWKLEYLYPWVIEREEAVEKLDYAKLMLPAVEDDPEMDRRLRKLIVDLLIELDRDEEAYNEAKAFVDVHKNSGDGWMLLGRTAAATDKPFEADRAWSVVTDRATPVNIIWWEGMLGRFGVRAQSTRPESACQLAAQMAQHQEHVPQSVAQKVSETLGASRCELPITTSETGEFSKS
ncbi:MAG: hypothetical protein AAF384_02825 [Pseudomonadota bacterium]